MMNEENIRLKEELDSLHMKCDELNRALCCQLDENRSLRDRLAVLEEDLHHQEAENAFLRGKVEAYEFMCKNGGRSNG